MMNLSLISALMLCAALATAQIPGNSAAAPGAYDTKAWRADWPGCPWEDGVSEGRISVVARPDGKRWRVGCFAVGEDGIEPNVPYRLGPDGKPVRVEVQS